MKHAKTHFRQLTVLCLATLLAAGCLTSQQVREAVVTSNAAMVSPSLDVPGAAVADSDWRTPVTQLDQLIAQNADQPTLVNHLRVRQAMVLTVYKQDNLATERWNQVDAAALKTERDKGLYRNREALVWWYRRAADVSPLDASEKSRAESYIATLDETLKTVSDPDLRFYLGTTRAQMNLKRLNDADVSTEPRQQEAGEATVTALSEYIDLFSDEERRWVNSDQTAALDDGRMIADFRRRSVLAELIRQYCQLSKNLELANLQWKPEDLNWALLCPGGS